MSNEHVSLSRRLQPTVTLNDDTADDVTAHVQRWDFQVELWKSPSISLPDESVTSTSRRSANSTSVDDTDNNKRTSPGASEPSKQTSLTSAQSTQGMVAGSETGVQRDN